MIKKWICIISIFLVGCQTTNSISSKEESPEDIQTALESVAEALAGKDLTQQEKEELAEQIQSDPEAQSAIETITNALEQQQVKMKYSPTTGKRYSADLEYDPETGEKLEWLE